MKSIFAVGSWALFATAACAAPPPPAPPTAITEEAISKWVAANLSVEGWTLIVMNGEAVVFGSPDGVFVLSDGTIRTLIRNEYFQSQKFGPMDVRSTTKTMNFDCATKRARSLAMSIFAENNMGGESMKRTFEEAQWAAVPEDDAVQQRTMKRVCQAPTTGKKLR